MSSPPLWVSTTAAVRQLEAAAAEPRCVVGGGGWSLAAARPGGAPAALPSRRLTPSSLDWLTAPAPSRSRRAAAPLLSHGASAGLAAQPRSSPSPGPDRGHRSFQYEILSGICLHRLKIKKKF